MDKVIWEEVNLTFLPQCMMWRVRTQDERGETVFVEDFMRLENAMPVFQDIAKASHKTGRLMPIEKGDK